MRSRGWVLSWVLGTIVALPGSSGCKREVAELTPLAELVARTKPSNLKILLIGIDGGTFRVADPLLANGQLPNLARLIANGARGPLRSQLPMRSPALWTTIATGRPRQQHNIHRFWSTGPHVKKDERKLVSSRDRETNALWNLGGPFGKKVGFVGWWASWPAEPVDGWIISDRLTRGRWTEWLGAQRGAQSTFPKALASELGPLIVDPNAPPLTEISRLAQFTDAELSEMKAVTKPVFGHWLSVSKFAYCAQRSNEKIALHMLARGQPDLTGVYLVAADPISHTFWHFYEPEGFPKGAVNLADVARLGTAIPNIYRHNDAYVGELLAAVDPNTVVFILSDHGFKAAGRVPRSAPAKNVIGNFDEKMHAAMAEGRVTIGQSGAHEINGVFVASGGPIRRGIQTKAKLLDIAPTVLALMGLPVADDMPGRVLEDIVEPSFWREHPIERIDSYERIVPRQRMPAPGSVDDEEALEMLRALGYIE